MTLYLLLTETPPNDFSNFELKSWFGLFSNSAVPLGPFRPPSSLPSVFLWLLPLPLPFPPPPLSLSLSGMRTWVKLAVSTALPAGAVLLVLFAAIAVCRHRRRQRPSPTDASDDKPPLRAKVTGLTLQEGISRLRLSLRSQATGLGFHGTHRNHRRHHDGHLRRPLADFSWVDQPHLAADAAAGGWSRFVFLDRDESPTRSGSLLSSCVSCEVGQSNPGAAAEADCEMPVGSSEFMQTVRIYPYGDGPGYSCIRMNLPLPGPHLGGDRPFFPPEAYFEIIIHHLQPLPRRRRQFRRMAHRKGGCSDGDRRKLIQDNPAAVLTDESSQGDADDSSLVRGRDKEEDKEAEVVVCLGLTRGGGPPDSPPGSYPGSIGFNSRGCINLDGNQRKSISYLVND